MHPEVTSDKPGKCHKCGGMDLVKKGNEDQKGEHDHSMMMSGPDVAQSFLKRFYIVSFLLIPLFVLSNFGQSLIKYPDFSFRHYFEFTIASIIFYFGFIFFQHARHEIMAKQYGMMTLVSLAVGSGYLFSALSTFLPNLQGGFYLEISTLIWVLLFGHYLEAKSSSAAGDALKEVAKLLPSTAHLLLSDGKTKDINVEDLKVGDVVLVKPGEKMPADGVVVDGEASLDESLLTGESKPISKNKDDRVISGSISVDGSLKVKIERVGENSTVGQIKQLISQAQKTKPKTQLLANKASKILTFSALSVSIITILIWTILIGQPFVFALTLAITVLVIACPHALGLAIPTVTTITTTMATKHGLFLKDLGKLERIKDINYVIMDKTGTLTKGEFGVTGIETLNNENKDNILKIAAELEQNSSHVIGFSIVKYAKKKGLALQEVGSFKNIAGMGVEGMINNTKYIVGNRALIESRGLWSVSADQISKRFSEEGKTVVFIADNRRIIGGLMLSDSIKPESASAIADLHKLGIKVAMLTGDNEAVAKDVAKELKLDTYFANVLPEDKFKKVKELQDEGNVVMMVGDGVNDAPALTQADVGIAIGAGTDVAVEAGDIVLTRSNPQDIVSLIILGRKTYRKMMENLIWATGYNIFAIPAAAGIFAPFGFFLSPGVGAFLMSLSSVIVVINALALKKAKLDL
ncbi:MAG: heavy metal translocating P-type ATPase [bacterium]|nr:heavy metal translocating P-type ATPase [bacterium]